MLPLLAVVAFLNGQTANNWTFGYHLGLNFSTTPPTFFLDSIRNRDCLGGSEIASYASNSISDCEGNLLFYTNGNVVWNRNHHLMPNYCLNDSMTIGGITLKTKILKVPKNDSLYYVFYAITANGNPGIGGTRYAIINMNADSARGTIVSTHNFINTFNIGLGSTQFFPSDLIKHSNDSNYWLVCKPTDNDMYAYLITSSGINLTPVISSAPGLNSKKEFIRASLTGNYIFYQEFPTGIEYANICTFNKSNGTVTNVKRAFGVADIGYFNVIDMEFSTNDSFIYITVNNGKYSVMQFKSYLSNPGSSFTELYSQTSGANCPVAIQMAPDGKIYISSLNSGIISCITRPDEAGLGCNFIHNYMNLAPYLIGYGFPSIYFPLKRLKFNATDYSSNICLTDSVRLFAQGDTTFVNYRWYFYDTTNVLIDSAEGKNISLLLNTGPYKIKLRAKNAECNSYTWWTDDIFVRNKPRVFTAIDSAKISCAKQTVYLHDSVTFKDSVQVNWGDGNFSAWQYAKGNFIKSHDYYDSSKVYNITITAKNGNCTTVVTLIDTVSLRPKPQAKFYANNASKTFPIKGCTILNINLSDSSKNADSVWYVAKSVNGNNFQFSTFNFQLQDSGWYEITQYTTTNDGCLDSFVVKNSVYVSLKPTIIIQKDTTYKACIQDHLRLKINSSYNDSVIINWGDGTSNYFIGAINGSKTDTITHNYANPGSYVITAISNNAYCYVQDFTTHLVRPPLQITTANDTTICIGRFASLWAFATGADSVFTYILKGGATTLQNTTGLFLVAPNATTTYYIGGINSCAKDTIWKQITVTVRPGLAVQLIAKDTTLCKGMSYTLKAAGTGGDTPNYNISLLKSGVFLQSNTSGVFTFIVDTTANYSLILSDGCSPSDTMKLIITIRPPLKLKTIKDTTLCQAGNITLQTFGIGGDSASFNFSLYKSGSLLQSNHSGTFTFFTDSTTTYSIILTDMCGINDTVNFKVYREDLKLKLNFTDTAICKGASLNLKATGTGGNGSYVFSLYNSSLQLISANTMSRPEIGLHKKV